jgi:hypothetical protein
MTLVRKRPRAAAQIILVLAGLAAAVTGCADGAEPPGVASAASTTPSGSASAASDPVARYVESSRRWVKCIRAQGFDVPDPDAKGHVDLGAVGVPSKTDSKWLAAQKGCKGILLEVPNELEEGWEPRTPEQIGWRRDYAKCMRANGTPSFSDPKPDGTWPEESTSGELTEQERAADFRAQQICAPVLEGRPPGTPDPSNPGLG